MFGGRSARLVGFVAALVMRAAIAAASGGDEVQEGEVVVLITDHREAIDDFASLVVTVTGARLHQRGRVPEQGWTVIEAPRQEVDLTRYRDGATFELVRAPVAAGRYDAADLILAGDTVQPAAWCSRVTGSECRWRSRRRGWRWRCGRIR